MRKKNKYFHYFVSRLAGFESSCKGKINYHNEARAIDASLKMGQKFGDKFVPYPCVFCHGWHIGHKKKFELEKEV